MYATFMIRYAYKIESPMNLSAYDNNICPKINSLSTNRLLVDSGKCNYIVLKNKLISGTYTTKHKPSSK